MNVQDYRAAGYGLSVAIDQAVIDRAVSDVLSAYIVPLVGHKPTQAESDAEPLKTAIMALSFLLVQQRSVVATRAGAKTKMTEQSNTPTYDDIMRQNARSCVRALCVLNTSVNPAKVCNDICGLFFRSNYFAQH